MSSIYSGGVKATAIAAIKAEVISQWSEMADGSMDLNREALTQWLADQFAQMLTDMEATSVSFTSNMAAQSREMVMSLSNAVSRSKLSLDPRWPVKSDALTSDSNKIAGVAQKQATLKSLSDQITALYANIQAQVHALIVDYFNANVRANIPAAVARIVTPLTYIYTYVTDRSDESEPSLASPVIERDQNDTVTVLVTPPPAGRSVTYIRLYRSANGNNSSDFLLVPNPANVLGWVIANLTTVDGKLRIIDTTAQEDLQEACPSFDWTEPPDDSRWAVSMANGITVMGSGNSIMPSVAFRPFAYPIEWRKQTTDPLVGLCALDQLLVAGTVGSLKILYGVSPNQLSDVTHNSGETVAAGRSMVALTSGYVAFASFNGVCIVDAAGNVKNITGEDGFNLFTTVDWAALDPAQIFASEFEGNYIFHVPAGFCYILNVKSGKLTTLNVTGSTFFKNSRTNILYMTQGTKLLAIGQSSSPRTGKWKSMRAVLAKVTGFQWLQVRSLDFASPVTIRLYRDGVLWHTRVLTDNTPVLLPPGKGEEWETEVEAACRVDEVLVAESTKELQGL